MWTSVSPGHHADLPLLRGPPDAVRQVAHGVAAQVGLKAKFEGGSSYYSFKRLVPGTFNAGIDTDNLHRPTMARVTSSPFTASYDSTQNMCRSVLMNSRCLSAG